MVIDGRLVMAGSFNCTAPATTLNDENIVVLGDLEEEDPVAEAAQQQQATFGSPRSNASSPISGCPYSSDDFGTADHIGSTRTSPGA